MKTAVLTSPNQWYVPHAETLARELGGVPIYFDHAHVEEPLDCLFILAYHRLVPDSVLKRHHFNPVIHESALPEGKGWSPLFWQILEGRSDIVFTMFEAQGSADSGEIYMQRTLSLTGYELNAELRYRQARLTHDMCLEFYRSTESFLPPHPQSGDPSYYPKRNPADSRLDIDRSIREQFNLLRIVDNEEFPAYFDIDGHRYRLKIEEVDDDGVDS